MGNSKLLNVLSDQTIAEIVDIQKAAMIIASNGIDSKINIYKRPVQLWLLQTLANHFKVEIVPADKLYSTPAYIALKTNSCNVIVQLETNK